MENLALEFPSIVPGDCKAKEITIDSCMENDTTLLQYPLKKFNCCHQSTREKYNILIFLLESWRFDMMNDQVTPIICEFAKKAICLRTI